MPASQKRLHPVEPLDCTGAKVPSQSFKELGGALCQWLKSLTMLEDGISWVHARVSEWVVIGD